MEPMLLTPEETARTLHIARTRVYAMIAEGVLPSIKIGSSRRIPVAALEKWIAEHTTTMPFEP